MGNTTSKELEDELRMVMIGKTGCGKSATGNAILQKEWFESKASPSSITRHCKRGENIIETPTKRYNIVLVDTPGLYDTGMSNEEISKEIVKCVSISSPGPHAILFIIPLAGRFTQEETATALHFINLFGEKLMEFMVIIFTHGDNLGKNETIDQRVEVAPQPLRELIKHCGNRYVVFNNTQASKDKKKKQLNTLIDVIKNMIESNGQNFYTDEMYKKAEEELQKRMEELAKINEKAKTVDLRRTVRQEVEEEKDLLSYVGQGIYTFGKGMVETAVQATGIPGFMKGLTSWFGNSSS